MHFITNILNDCVVLKSVKISGEVVSQKGRKMSDDSHSAAPNKKPRGILKNSSSFDQTGAMGGAG